MLAGEWMGYDEIVRGDLCRLTGPVAAFAREGIGTRETPHHQGKMTCRLEVDGPGREFPCVPPLAVHPRDPGVLMTPFSECRCRSQTPLELAAQFQKGVTTTNTTMSIIRSVGSSLIMRKNRAECRLRSSAKALSQPPIRM